MKGNVIPTGSVLDLKQIATSVFQGVRISGFHCILHEICREQLWQCSDAQEIQRLLNMSNSQAGEKHSELNVNIHKIIYIKIYLSIYIVRRDMTNNINSLLQVHL